MTTAAGRARPPHRRAAAPAPARDVLPSDSPLLRRLAGGPGEERVLRVFAFGFLPGGVVFGLLVTPRLSQQFEYYPVWWIQAVLAGMVLSATLMGALAFLAPVWVLRTLAGISALSGLLAQLSILPIAASWRGPLPSAPPWINDILALGAVAAGIALPGLGALAVTVATALLTFVDYDAVTRGHWLHALQAALYILLFCITFVAFGISSLRAARLAELAEAEALRTVTAAAADNARERERARINALVHDRVLATLLAAARNVPGSEQLRRQDARRALEGLRDLLRSDDDGSAVALSGEELAWALQGVTTDLMPDAVFGYEVHDDVTLPAEAVETLTAATEEALRNSARHAGEANRTVHVLVDRSRVRVDVLDDGAGFDPEQVPPNRLGIARSIKGRMADLEGGSAVIVSQQGVGTRVQLRYKPPAS
ncbi:ATP-binding protein [Amnibacterium sp. CER49]|uniref:sensor histidine kinase n=1 Tax=Amnibacterium sp. CER49 TaxID=3039161 RepID=UPI00244928A4|nr:ATP-binding protein [Amnibacterium sp. CER49]MDH2442983.1 ATP-binding protein [Amnibacterium sp. CER49]